jgi:hypothetical protein
VGFSVPTIKLTKVEQILRDIDHIDDRLDRFELHGNLEAAILASLQKQKLMDELGEFTRTKELPVKKPVAWRVL